MTLQEWEALLGRELGAAGFDFERPSLTLAWDVFCRLLPEVLEHDAGAHVWGRVVDWEDGRPLYWLSYARHSERDEAYSHMAGILFTTPATKALKRLQFAVFQRPQESTTGVLMTLAEFFAATDSTPKFKAVFAHLGEWKAEPWRASLCS